MNKLKMISVEKPSSVNIINLHGSSLTSENTKKLKQEFIKSLSQRVEVIIIDLRNLSFINHEGSQLLKTCAQEAKKLGIKLFIKRFQAW
ncbi:MAG: STAS domain-containing protein [Prochloraceae cyanobacterium]